MVEVVVMCCRCDYVVHGEIYGGLNGVVPRAWWWLPREKVVVVLLFC